jgi:DNA-binding LacI/PurR family transcriptional regulator
MESYHIIVLETQNDAQRLLQAIHVLAEQCVKGILMSVIGNGPIPKVGMLEMRSQGIVSVLYDSYIENHTFDEVMLDESHIAMLAAPPQTIHISPLLVKRASCGAPRQLRPMK